MGILLRLLTPLISLFVATYLLAGVRVSGGWQTYAILTLALLVVNTIVKPVLKLLTLPLNIMTLGLFALVLNALLVLLVAYIVPNFSVSSFIYALAFGLIYAVVQFVFKRFE